MAIVVFVLANTALVWTSLRLARQACGTSEPWRQAIAAAALFPTLVTTVLLPLGAFGWLNRGAQLAGSLLVLAATELAVLGFRKREGAPVARGHEEPLATMDEGEGGQSGTLRMGVALAFAAWTFEAVFLRPKLPPIRYDDFTYHAPAVFEWLSRASFERAAILDYHSYFPFNGELLALWYLLPFGRDGLYEFAGLTWAGLGSVAVYGIARGASADRPAALLAATAFLGGRGILLEARSFASGDLALAALLLSSVGMVIPGRGSAEVPPGRLLLAGAFGGVAWGAKITALPVLAVIAASVAFGGGERTRGAVAKRLAFLGAPALLLGAFWYARTWLVTGSPFYPAAVGPFWGPFDATSQKATTLIHWIGAGGGSLRRLALVVVRYGHWGGLLGLVPAIGVLMAGRSLCRARSAWGSRTSASSLEVRRWVLLLGVAFVVLVVFPFTPFSGTPNNPSGTLRVALRFVILPYAVGCALLASFARGPLTFAVFGALLLSAAREGTFVDVFVTPPLALAGWAALRTWAPRLPRLRTSGPLVLAASVALLATVGGALEPRLQSRVDRMVFGVRSGGVPLGEAWRWIDALPPGAEIAAYGHLRNHVYGIYGRRLQHRPVALFADGTRQPKDLHEHWAHARTHGWWARPAREPDVTNFSRNVEQAGVDYLLFVRAPGGDWPAQKRVLASAPGASRVQRSQTAELWRVTSRR